MTSSQASAAPCPSVLDLAPVVPVVVIEDAADAVPLARALVAGGLPAIEVTLRTPAALDAIRAIAAEVPEAVVGAGTVISRGAVDAAGRGRGALPGQPGLDGPLLDAMQASGVPFLPGVSTTSEVVALLERGVTRDEVLPGGGGGRHGLPQVPRRARSRRPASARPGGISLASAPGVPGAAERRLRGRHWMLPADALAAQDWARVEALAREAAALRG